MKRVHVLTVTLVLLVCLAIYSRNGQANEIPTFVLFPEWALCHESYNFCEVYDLRWLRAKHFFSDIKFIWIMLGDELMEERQKFDKESVDILFAQLKKKRGIIATSTETQWKNRISIKQNMSYK